MSDTRCATDTRYFPERDADYRRVIKALLGGRPGGPPSVETWARIAVNGLRGEGAEPPAGDADRCRACASLLEIESWDTPVPYCPNACDEQGVTDQPTQEPRPGRISDYYGGDDE